MTAHAGDLLHHEVHRTRSGGEWLVLIHGAGGSTVTWKRQVPVLGQHHNLLLVDLPGHGQMAGRSNTEPHYTFDRIAQRIWAVVDHVGISRVHLVGVSLGTVIALTMREQQPARVASLVNGGAILRLSKRLKLLATASLALAKVIGYPAFYRLSARVMMPRRNHEASRKVFIRESRFLSDAEFRKWTAMYRGLNATLKHLFAQASDIPHLVVMGAQDHLFVQEAHAYARRHPAVRLEVVARCGHVVTIERADRFNALCLDFLAGLGRG
ncbi:MAG: alpha/beta fold hydrolase [Flavobacteriales bacterium]|nr:MAG: alpha/beta fold hydrolase [Flavobacteriales bacterium]